MKANGFLICTAALLAPFVTAALVERQPPFFSTQYDDTCFGSGWSPADDGWSPPLPDRDPFYVPPPNWESLEVGTLIRSRPIEVEPFGILNQTICRAYNILYRSSYGNGTAITTGGAIIVPVNVSRGPTKLVSYQIAEDATSTLCAPSYTIRLNAQGSNIGNQVELILVNYLLQSGYVVVLPDYEGPDSQYGPAFSAARGTLDGIRAALQFASAVPDPENATYAMIGYSGGAIATGYAAQEQPQYAPDLKNFVGAAIGGLPANTTTTILNLNGGAGSAAVYATMWSEVAASKQLRDYLMPHVNATSLLYWSQINNQCLTGNTYIYANHDVFGLFEGLTADEILHSEAWQQTLGQTVLNLPGAPMPQMPLYLYKAAGDTAIGPVQDELYYQQLCQRGVGSLLYDFNYYGEHGQEFVIGFQHALEWLQSRFGNQPPVQGCKKTFRNETTLDRNFLRHYPPALNSALNGFLAMTGGSPIGETPGNFTVSI